jgi:hypothetical protein
MAVNTVRPKKNGNPQSKLVLSELVPARLTNAASLLELPPHCSVDTWAISTLSDSVW